MQAQDVSVVCRSTDSCRDGDEIGVMSARECCVENSNGLAYTIPGQAACTVCIGECMHAAC